MATLNTDQAYAAIGDTPAETPVKVIDSSSGTVYTITEIMFEAAPESDDVAPLGIVWIKIEEVDG